MHWITYSRKLLLLLILFGLFAACNPPVQEVVSPAEPTLFFIVRHAEKESEGVDPDLNLKGKARALLLEEIFSNTPISAIYSTPFLRNMETVRPLADARNIPIHTYDPNDTPALIEAIFEQYEGGQVLIVGHSNTVPGMVNTLIWEDRFADLKEDEYQRLFIITGFKEQKGSYSEISFNP
jgi:broad specificity phosphatase PhoE